MKQFVEDLTIEKLILLIQFLLISPIFFAILFSNYITYSLIQVYSENLVIISSMIIISGYFFITFISVLYIIKHSNLHIIQEYTKLKYP